MFLGTLMITVVLLAGCGASSVWQDVQNGDTDKVQSQIESGADVDARDALGRTPLYYAIYKKHPEIIGLLVRSGANVNMKHKADKTPLHMAAELGDTPTVRLLTSTSMLASSVENPEPSKSSGLLIVKVWLPFVKIVAGDLRPVVSVLVRPSTTRSKRAVPTDGFTSARTIVSVTCWPVTHAPRMQSATGPVSVR